MKPLLKYLLTGSASAVMLSAVVTSDSEAYTRSSRHQYSYQVAPLDSDSPATNPEAPAQFTDQSGLDPLYFSNNGPLKLNDPSNIQTQVTFQNDSGAPSYLVEQKLGNQLS
ncbi:MAG: hypothetical protein ACRC3B_01790, partial [Bacteroidia bacterium]